MLVALIVTPILFQRLGEEQYGLVNLALSVVMLLGILVHYGFHLNGPKRLALILDSPKEKSVLLNEIIATRLLLSILMIIGVLIGTYFFGLFPNYPIILTLSMVMLLTEAFSPMMILQGLERLSILAIGNAVSRLLYVATILVFVTWPEDAIWVNFFMGGASLIVNIVLLTYIYLNQSLRIRWVAFARIRERLKENFEFFLSTIAGHISVHGGIIILSNFVDDIELGRYALAQKVAFLLRMVPVFLTQSILQDASRLYQNDKTGFQNYLKKAHLGGLALTALIGVIFSLTSAWVIRVVGGEYVDYSADILRLLAFIPFLGMLNVGNMIKILVTEQKDVLAKATWLTAIFMLIVGISGSYFYGGYGLAWALLISELVSFLVHYFILKAKTGKL